MKSLTSDQIATYHSQGYMLVEGVLDSSEVTAFRVAFSSPNTNQSTQRGSAVYGLRNILQDIPQVNDLARSARSTNLAHQLLIDTQCATENPTPFPTRGLYFDKLEGANWRLPWHQDLAIAVKEKVPTEGYTAWSQKEGIPHVIPPQRILEQRIALRFHLDDSTCDSGSLLVIPGTHRLGRITHLQITELVETGDTVTCICKSGDLLLMHPLLLHASQPATIPTHRRVIHIEYAASKLDGDLQWYAE